MFYLFRRSRQNFTRTNYQTYSAEKYGDVIAKYEIENEECNYTRGYISRALENKP